PVGGRGDVVGERADLVERREVRDVRSLRADLLRNRLHLGRVAAVDVDGVALVGEPLGDRAAETVGRTGDQDGLHRSPFAAASTIELSMSHSTGARSSVSALLP